MIIIMIIMTMVDRRPTWGWWWLQQHWCFCWWPLWWYCHYIFLDTQVSLPPTQPCHMLVRWLFGHTFWISILSSSLDRHRASAESCDRWDIWSEWLAKWARVCGGLNAFHKYVRRLKWIKERKKGIFLRNNDADSDFDDNDNDDDNDDKTRVARSGQTAASKEPDVPIFHSFFFAPFP